MQKLFDQRYIVAHLDSLITQYNKRIAKLRLAGVEAHALSDSLKVELTMSDEDYNVIGKLIGFRAFIEHAEQDCLIGKLKSSINKQARFGEI